jgi:HK97 family phage major capsid protein
MPTTELREQRANVWSQMTEIMDRAHQEKRDLTVDEQTTYDKAEADLDSLSARIEREEKHEARAEAFNHVDRRGVVPTDGPARESDEPTYEESFNNYLKGGIGSLRADQRKVLQDGHSDALKNALSVGTNSAGGYLVPPGYRQEFIVQMKDFGAVREVAQVISTDSGNPLQWPTMNDTANVGRLLAENTQMTETDVVVGTATLSAYVYSSDLTRVSLQLANDAAFDVGNLVRTAHAERIGRITNQHFTTGTGTAQPQGIVTGATNGKTAAGVAAITADEIIDLTHSVDPAYRRSPRAQFMLSDTALSLLRKLKDSNGMYLWQPNVQAGAAATLFGYGYVINQDMAVPATGVKSVLFGDFQAGYVIREVTDLQVITFTERYLDYLQVGHSSYLRADGKVQNASAYKALTQA